MSNSPKLAIVVSHPIQYFSPWFRWIAAESGCRLRVFFLDDPAARRAEDPDFGRRVQWDIPLLEGFDSCFVSNRARDPGTHHFFGLNNPSLWPEVKAFDPGMTLLMTYRYQSILPAMLRGSLPPNCWLRGDSTLLSRTHRWSQRLSDWVVRRAFASLAGALYVGQHNRAYFRHHGLADQQLVYSPPAVDMTALQVTADCAADHQGWREELGIPKAHKVVLFVGKLQSIKRPMLLLDAFRLAAVADCSLVFVGTGEQSALLARAASDDARIHLAGFRNQRALPAIYAGADLLVLPSVSETWGLVVNEAFSMGTGALVSDQVGCAPDMVAGRGTGQVFASDNVEALAAALGNALSSPATLSLWGQKARALVQTKYNFAAMTEGLQQSLERTA